MEKRGKKKIYVFHSGITQRNEIGLSYFAPYIYGLLRSYAEQFSELRASYSWPLILNFGNNLDEIIQEIKEPSVFAISIYLWNRKKSLELARIVKEKYPDCLIVAGGPDVPDDGSEFLRENPQVDFLVHGEGERPFSEILKWNLTGGEPCINGTSFRDIEGVVKYFPREKFDLTLKMSSNPHSYLVDYAEQIRKKDLRPVAIFETNRGCPYACTFCDWGSNTATQVRQIPIEKIEREIESICSAGYEMAFCADANFGMFPRDVEIIKLFIKYKKKYGFPKQVFLNTSKNLNERVLEIGAMLKENFEIQQDITLSVQSMDFEVLKNIKRENIGFQKYLDLQKNFIDKGVNTYSELILGLPGESLESWKNGFVSLVDHKVYNFFVYPFYYCENSPFTSNGDIEKFHLKLERVSRSEHFYIIGGEIKNETVDMVTSSSTMSKEDYVWMIILPEFIHALNEWGMVSVLNEYFYRKNISAGLFNVDFFNYLISQKDPLFGEFLHSLHKELKENLDLIVRGDLGREDREIQGVRIGGYHHLKRYISVFFKVNVEEFFRILTLFLSENYRLSIQEEISDLLRFQESLTFKPENLKNDEVQDFDYNWFEFFNNSEVLTKKRGRYLFKSPFKGQSLEQKGNFIRLMTSRMLRVGLLSDRALRVNNIEIL